MNPETYDILLKALEMVGTGGDAAFWLLLLWVLRPILILIVVAITIGLAVIYATKTFTYYSNLQRFADEVRNASGVNRPYGEVTEFDRHSVFEIIKRGKSRMTGSDSQKYNGAD